MPRQFPPEFRQRALRMVEESRAAWSSFGKMTAVSWARAASRTLRPIECALMCGIVQPNAHP